MRLTEILAKNRFNVSIELRPPNGGFNIDKLQKQLKIYNVLDIVDFYSMTMGAGGNAERNGTISLSHKVQDWTGKDCITHLTYLDKTKNDIREKVVDIHHLDLENILALRGDVSKVQRDIGVNPINNGCYTYATDLVKHLRELNNFCIGVAAYPEGYPRENDVGKAVEVLKINQDVGANFAITQMCFDSEKYINFMKKCDDAGIIIPVIPGIWMISSYSQALAVETNSQFEVSVPEKLKYELKNAKTKDEGKEIGLKYTLDLCKTLKEVGVPGIHLFMHGIKYHSLELIKNIKR